MGHAFAQTIGSFVAVARARPDRDALDLGAGRVLSYGALAHAAGGVARVLAADGAAGDRVGLLLDEPAEVVAGMLGALAVRRCYVPLDPRYPAARLATMLCAARPTVVLTTRQRRSLAVDLVEKAGLADRCRLLCVPDIAPAELVVDPSGTPGDMAYLLYTSGSTGRPKGVAQTEGNLRHAALNQIRSLSITADDRLSLLASVSFDAAISDIYPGLLCGATLVPIDVRRHGPRELADELVARRVTVYHSTPTLYRYLTGSIPPGFRLPDVRVVLLGGEPVHAGDLRAARRHFGPSCVFVNGYGATEATFVTQHRVPVGSEAELGEQPVPIGRPLPGYHVELVGADGRSGPEGEIVVHSRHLAPGYTNDPAWTARQFSTQPDGTLVYRTGDLGRWLPSGLLVYCGRLDRQIKVRGVRVELAEVEAHLEALPGVTRAAVTVDLGGSAGIGARLVGYVQAAPGATLHPVALRKSLAGRLPEHVVPGALVVLDSLPLTSTGKVDVGALPQPTSAVDLGRSGAAGAGGGKAMMTPTQRLVATAWCAVLGLPEVRSDQHFFDLGGDSLRLAQVQQRLVAALGRTVPLVRLLEHPTVEALAGYLDGQQPAAGAPVRQAADRAVRRHRARSARVRTGRPGRD